MKAWHFLAPWKKITLTAAGGFFCLGVGLALFIIVVTDSDFGAIRNWVGIAFIFLGALFLHFSGKYIDKYSYDTTPNRQKGEGDG